MKGLRIVSFSVGLAALGITIYQIYQSVSRIIQSGIPWNRLMLWEWIYLWPDWIVSRLEYILRFPSGYDILHLVIYIVAIIVSILLARSLKRSAWDWGILALFLPYLSTLLLPFRPEKRSQAKSVIGQTFLGAFTNRTSFNHEMVIILRRITLAVGIVAVLITVYDVILRTSIFGFFDVGKALLYWPDRVIWLLQVIRYSNPLMVLTSPAFYEVVTIYGGAFLLTLALAFALNRSRADWGLLGIFLPYVSTAILAVIEPNPEPGKGLVGRLFSSLFAGSSGSGFSVAKNCSKCGKAVSAAARAGQRCPHCGAYWSYEKER